jgi:hypothetical protein
MFPSLAARQVAIRRGEVNVIAGQAGSGKSSLATAIAYRAQVPTLYVCMDTHKDTMSMRLISMVLNTPSNVVEEAMLDRTWASEVLEQAGWFTWSFESVGDVEGIEQELLAFIELHGTSPELTIVDNLTDVSTDGAGEWEGARNLMKDFKYLSRAYDTSLLVLHHTGDKYLESGTCPARWDLMGKVSQTPALILTVAQNDAGFIGVCPVKNRYGPAVPSGREPTWLRFDASAMQITEVESDFNGL